MAGHMLSHVNETFLHVAWKPQESWSHSWLATPNPSCKTKEEPFGTLSNYGKDGNRREGRGRKYDFLLLVPTQVGG